MKNKINILLLVIALASMSMWYSCEKSDVFNEMPEIYENVDGVKILPGRNRAKLVIDNDENVSSYTVDYWPGYLTDKKKSVTVVATGSPVTEVIINDLEENKYSFDITEVRTTGESQRLGKAIGRSYGANYEKSLQNRQPMLVEFQSLVLGTTYWGEVPDGLVLSEIEYDSSTGRVIKKVTKETTEVTIDNFAGEDILYRSLFVPLEGAIDTFSAHFDTIVIMPRVPVDPFPAKGSISNLKPELIWDNSLETAEAILYMGEDSMNMAIVDTLTSGYFQSFELKQNTKYFWRVDPKSEVGFSQKGDVWNFTTESINPVSLISPQTGDDGVKMISFLEWESAGVGAKYNLYLGTSEDNMELVGEKLTKTTTIPGVFMGNQTYYARVELVGGELPENIATGEVTSFTTDNGAFVNFHRSDKSELEGAFNYSAAHENAATFTEQSFSMFGTTVSIFPHWADGAKRETMQMIHRGYHNYPDLYLPVLFADWIGTDARSPGDPFTLVIKGLPAGEYEWRSWHVDFGGGQTGAFDLTLKDANGENLVAETFDIKDTNSDLKNDRNFNNAPPLTTTIVSNGTDDIELVFKLVYPYGTGTIYKFLVLNGFELIKK